MENSVRIIEVKRNIMSKNEEEAQKLREELAEKGIFLINVMSSPGSGKTSTLTKLINMLKDELKIAVIEADIDSDVDARTIAELTGVKAIQLHTGGGCHVEANMTAESLKALGAGDMDVVFLENIGNLVCPAAFDTGASKNLTILSVPEGDDKPLKYPGMYRICDLVVLNKIDVLPYFDFDTEKFAEYIKIRNPKAVILPISAKTGEGVDKLADWVRREVAEFRASR